MKNVANFVTGSKRGYVKVKNQGIESEYIKIPNSLKGQRGNIRRALESFTAKGATHYTITEYQGVPGKGYSSQYKYAEYKGYRE